MEKELNNLISYIKNSDNYKRVILIKNQMSNNKDIINMIDGIKKNQKLYLRYNDNKYLKLVEEETAKLKEIPIYNMYLDSLEKVNDMIEVVRDELNEYFINIMK